MSGMQLDNVKPRLISAFGGRDKIVNHLGDIALIHLLRHFAVRSERDRARRDNFPFLIVGQRCIAFPGNGFAGFAARMANLHADLGVGAGMDEIDNFFPGLHMAVFIHAGIAGRYAGFS